VPKSGDKRGDVLLLAQPVRRDEMRGGVRLDIYIGVFGNGFTTDLYGNTFRATIAP